MRDRTPRPAADVRLMHVDSCESNRALDAGSEARAEFANERRFLLDSLLFGRVRKGHARGSPQLTSSEL